MNPNELLTEAQAVIRSVVTSAQVDGARRIAEIWTESPHESDLERTYRVQSEADLAAKVSAYETWDPRFRALLVDLELVDPREWQEAVSTSIAEGIYTVTLDRLAEAKGDPAGVWVEDYLSVSISVHAGVPLEVARELMKRVQHVGPEQLQTGVSLDDAIQIKADLERWGARVRIKEGAVRNANTREPIPERIRREVWRRDGGKCVDCGSRERLEYDHIIPVSKGGANTARNIELRCESCNRRKAATI